MREIRVAAAQFENQGFQGQGGVPPTQGGTLGSQRGSSQDLMQVRLVGMPLDGRLRQGEGRGAPDLASLTGSRAVQRGCNKSRF